MRCGQYHPNIATEKMVKSTLHLVVTAYCGQINPWTLCRQAHVYKHHVHNYETYMYTVSAYITFAICISYSYIIVGVGYLCYYTSLR